MVANRRKLHAKVDMYASPQSAVVTNRNLDRTPRVARKELVKWLKLDINEIKRTSGGTFANRDSVLRLSVREVPSGVKTDLGWKKRTESKVSGRVTTASASANASECSNIVMPTSWMGVLPCNAQDKVSMNWPKPRETKRGHKRARDPDGRVEPGSAGNMFTALHDSSTVSQKRSAELALNRYPPSPPKSVSRSLPEAPYCMSDQPGEVWHRRA